jgi:hypothetical protein
MKLIPLRRHNLATGIPGVAEGGGNNEQKRGLRKDNLRFKNADAIGHPALAVPLFNNFMGSVHLSEGSK